MSIAVLTPSDWDMTAPVGGRGRLMGMTLKEADPFVRVLEVAPNLYTATHSHDEPEVFVVLSGRLMFNGQWVETGSVAFIPANADYWHSTGEERCVMALMRPRGRGVIHFAEEASAAE
jgi:quercetin dioxygenase-like cupin family protein